VSFWLTFTWLASPTSPIQIEMVDFSNYRWVKVGVSETITAFETVHFGGPISSIGI